jgi:glycosyltransferase involved in cell wall biosynthesis
MQILRAHELWPEGGKQARRKEMGSAIHRRSDLTVPSLSTSAELLTTVRMSRARMKIALFYYVIVRDNAIGMVDRTILEHLSEKYDFTVFSNRFDNPCPDRIRWVRVPCILSPSLCALVSFRVSASVLYFWHCIAGRLKFDIVHSSDAAFGPVQLADAHFCNRHYLLHVMNRRVKGLRDAASLLARVLGSVLERPIYRRARVVVVPSAGLRRELIQVHGIDAGKIVVVPLPNDTRMFPPDPKERLWAREELGLAVSDKTLVFAALGDFERKGLGLLIDALADSRLIDLKLLVVGGSPGALAPYRQRAKQGNIRERVIFCGKHPIIRSFLWAADALVLPSRYEVFPVVVMQAALTALPLITTRLNGVEEYAVDGVTGFYIAEPTAIAVADAVAKFFSLTENERKEMGLEALRAVRGFTAERFARSWESIYSQLALESNKHSITEGP